eukprot:CAMPEP_0184290372 /NCGR_PEP_ID=MMETSP1049-20130417/2648_1 /TAXON_ID=77928 /ORGANISM="Proteomonas sulcata, Strain CCMP704" /LENGTH=135 /DNA_ID=CAMNT_0026597515 /DNA_START=185 /DNA_END=592 /DNA_ORIENTATION=+
MNGVPASEEYQGASRHRQGFTLERARHDGVSNLISLVSSIRISDILPVLKLTTFGGVLHHESHRERGVVEVPTKFLAILIVVYVYGGQWVLVFIDLGAQNIYQKLPELWPLVQGAEGRFFRNLVMADASFVAHNL